MSGNMLGSISTSRSRREKSLLSGSFGAAMSTAEADELQERYGLSLPIHSLVSNSNSAGSRYGFLHTHVWSKCSRFDGFYQLSPGLYVCSPELTFLQMASLLSVCELVRLGFDMCGTYCAYRDYVEYQRDPLTSVANLRRIVEQHGGKKGIGKARRALKYVRDGSGSPKETAAAMLLGLPYMLGGASFGMPEMNHPVELNAAARSLADKSRCVCDLCFPKWHLDLEYESYEFHSSSAKMERDSLRRDALALMGINVITVTNRQLTDLRKLTALINVVSRATGKEFRPQCRNFYLRQNRLLAMLAYWPWRQ